MNMLPCSHTAALVLYMTPRLNYLIQEAKAQAIKAGAPVVGTEHLLYAMALDADGVTMQALSDVGVTSDMLRKTLFQILGGNNGLDNIQSMNNGQPEINDEEEDALKEFGRDITEEYKKDGRNGMV